MDKDFIQNIQSKQFDSAGKQVKETLAAKVLSVISAKRVEISEAQETNWAANQSPGQKFGATEKARRKARDEKIAKLSAAGDHEGARKVVPTSGNHGNPLE